MLPRPTVAASASPVLGVAHSRASEKKVCPALQPCDMCANSQLYFWSRLPGSSVCTGVAPGVHAGDVRSAWHRRGGSASQARAARAHGPPRRPPRKSSQPFSSSLVTSANLRFAEMIRTLRPRLCPTFHAGRICEPGRPTPRILALSSGSGPRQERAPGLGTCRAACRCPRGEPAFLARGRLCTGPTPTSGVARFNKFYLAAQVTAR